MDSHILLDVCFAANFPKNKFVLLKRKKSKECISKDSGQGDSHVCFDHI
jgi:hypothetical protein